MISIFFLARRLATADKNWEDEITKDLQEFEVVGGMTADGCEEAELERDLAAL